MAKTSAASRWRWAALAAVLFLGACAAAWLALPPAIAFVAERELRRAGFETASVAAADVGVGVGVVTVERVVLSDSLTLKAVQADIPFSGLIQGKIAVLNIGAADVRARWTPAEGVVIPGYRAAGGPPATALPVERIHVDQLTLNLESPYGAIAGRVSDAGMTADGSKLNIDAGLRLQSAYGQVRGKVAGRVDLADRALTAQLDITDGDLKGSPWRAGGLAGTVSLKAGGGGSAQAEMAVRAENVALAGRRLGPMALTGTWRDARLEGRLHAPDAGPVRIDAKFGADFSGDQPRFSSAGSLGLTRATGLAGEITYDAAGTLNMEAGAPHFSGDVEFAAKDIHFPGRIADAAFRLKAGVEGRADDIEVTVPMPVTGHVTPATGMMRDMLASYAEKPINFRLVTPTAGKPLSFRIDGMAPALSRRAVLELGVAGAEARAAGDIRLRRMEKSFAATLDNLNLTGKGIEWKNGVIHAFDFGGNARGSGIGDWRLTGEGRLAASGTTGAAGYRNLQLDWSGQVVAAEGVIGLKPDSCLPVTLAGLTYGDTRFRNLEMPCIDAGGSGTLLSYDVGSGDIRFDVETNEAPLRAVMNAERDRQLSGTWPSLSITGRMRPGDMGTLNAEAAGGALRAADVPAALRDMSGSLSVTPEAGLEAELAIGTIRSLAEPAFWTPAGLEIQAKGRDGTISFDAFLSDALGLFVFEATGQWSGDAGKADLTLYPINFLSGATEIGDLSPWLAGKVSDLSGTVSFDGDIAWGDGIESGGTLTLKDLAGQVSAVRVGDIAGTVEMASLLPPATAGPQTLRIGRVEAGVPLMDGRVRMDKPVGGPPEIGPLSFSLAGGTVTAAPFILNSSAGGETRVTLNVKDVDLARMIADIDVRGLTGTGTLAGQVPVVISADGVSIESGGLRAITEGELHYAPDELPPFLQGEDQRTRMLRQVLKNFQYNDLSVSLNGGLSSGQTVTLAAKGKNPDFLEGHPVELNFNFEGSLLSALKSAVSVSGMDRIQRLLEKRDGQGTE